MPRRTRRFDRAKAHTYEVVYRPLRDDSGTERVFRVVQRGNGSAGDGEEPPAFDDVSAQPETGLSYDRQQFELGEFGFPDDGYDIAKHFKSIGGRGGVFVSAPGASVKKPAIADSFTLREDVAEEEPVDDARKVEDERFRAEAIAEIRRERRRNTDLDEVFDALDSDGELASGDEAPAHDASVAPLEDADDDDDDDDGDMFPDDFIALANGHLLQSAVRAEPSEEEVGREEPAVVVQRQPKRKQRVLDDQFDELMKMYADDDDDDDEQEDEDWNPDDISSTEDGSELDVEDNLNDEQLAELLGSSDFVISKDEENAHDEKPDVENREKVDAIVESAGDQSTARTEVRDALGSFQHEEYAESQLTNAMDKLMDSFKRVSAEDAFAAIDGLDGARRAIAVRMHQEQQRGDEESGSEDSELDSVLNDNYRDRERWDCETVISTYSNLENHPSVIDDADGARRRPRRPLPPVIRLDPRTQLPVGGPATERAARASDADFGARRPPPVHNSARPRNKQETKDEKRLRKAAVKEAARERRAIKSEMKSAFAQEERVQQQHAAALGKSKVAVQF